MVLRSQQIFDGILPEMTDSTDSKMAENRPKVQTLAATTIDPGIPLVGTPRFGGRATMTGDQTGEDSDSDVERARQAFLEAQKKKARTAVREHFDSTHINEALDELLKWV